MGTQKARRRSPTNNASANNGRRGNVTSKSISTPGVPTADESAEGRKLGEVVARKIQRRIIAQGWPVGEVLGSENELLETYGVSRAVLREAIRLLEHHSIVTTRRGPGGGLVVCAPDISAVTNSVAMYLEYVAVSPDTIKEARTALETATVRLATERMDEDGISRIRAALESEADHIRNGIVDRRINDFHLTIAELSGNPALRLFLEVLIHLTVFNIRPELINRSKSQEFGEAAHKVHARIADAIIAGDFSLAVHRMVRHLGVLPDVLH